MLNENAIRLCQLSEQDCQQLQISEIRMGCGCRVFDCGVENPGSREAGLLIARICTADLAKVELLDAQPWPQVSVRTEHPVAACMASQYAGWEVKGAGYCAMGSGPMRAAAAREPLFQDIGFQERFEQCVGVLESAKLPPDEACREIATKCGIDPQDLTLLVAPTSSIVGTLQVVARSVEAAMHKLHELNFDLSRVERAEGTAPLPPVAGNDLAAIGRTNDAILYGGEVFLSVSGDDDSLQAIGELLPSSASKDYGRPFVEILADYKNEFYRVDPLLFGVAKIRLTNVDTGATHEFGQRNDEVLQQSFVDE